MKWDVYKVKNNIDRILDGDDISITEEKMSLFDFKNIVEEKMKTFGLAAKEVELASTINKKMGSFNKASKINNVSFYSSFKLSELGITFDLKKRGIDNLLVEYDENNKVFTKGTELMHFPTVNFLKDNFNEELESTFELMVRASDYFKSEFDDSRYFDVDGFSVGIPNTEINVSLGHVGNDEIVSNIILPDMDTEIIHFSKDFDLRSVVQENKESILKKTPILVKSLPSQYNNCIRDYYKK